MAWNDVLKKYVSDEDVERWEEILRREMYDNDLLTEILLYLSTDEKATIFYQIAAEYDIELPREEDEEEED